MVEVRTAKKIANSYPEKFIYFYLKQAGLNVKENVYLEDVIKIGKDNALKKSLDIYFEKDGKKFAIEYDGVHYHKNAAVDIQKNRLCRLNKINVIRIREHGLHVLDNYSYDYIMKRKCNTEELINSLMFIQDILERIFNIKIKFDIEEKRDIIEIEGMLNLNTPVYNSVKNVRPDLLNEWDYERNSLKPENISFKSHLLVYWNCPRGHAYLSRPMNRANGNNCPYCANKQLLRGYNDFKTLYPNLAKCWWPENIIKPQDILGKSNTILIWQCPHCKSLFEKSCYKMVDTHGYCPHCKKRAE